VIVLDEPVTGIEPAQLAAPNELDQYAQPRLNRTTFTAVGYGTEVRQADSGPQKPTPMSYPLVRRYTDVVGQKLTAQILQVNGNEHDDRGGGGTCFGDSGGPSLGPSGNVVTVTSYGYTSNCRYIDGLQRVDIPVVQDWLAEFGVTPAA
jgi:trypsin